MTEISVKSFFCDQYNNNNNNNNNSNGLLSAYLQCGSSSDNYLS